MAHLLLVLTTLFWSGNFVLARAMHLDIPPLTLSFLRWLFAFLILLPLVAPGLWRERFELLRHWKVLLVLSTLGVANFNSFVYLGLQTTTATNATLLQSAVPVIILLFSVALGQWIRVSQWLGVAVSLSGVLLIVSQGQPALLLELGINRGDLWILAAVLSWAAYSVGLRWKPESVTPRTFLGVNVLIGVFLLLPWFLWEYSAGYLVSWNGTSALVVAYVAIFPSVLAYFFWNRGIEELGAPRAGLYIHLMPVFGLLLSTLFLGERVQLFHLIGIGCIFTGIYLAARRGHLPSQP